MEKHHSLASDGIPTLRSPAGMSLDEQMGRAYSDGMQVVNTGSSRGKRPVSALPRQGTGVNRPQRPGSGGVERPGSGNVERGRIRPKSALAKSTIRETEPLNDDAVSVASTKRRPTSSVAASSRPQTAMSTSVDEGDESEANQSIAGQRKSWTLRRYFTKGLETPDGTRMMHHFSVYLPPNNALDTPTDYLRIYYCDCLAAEPVKPPFSQDDRTVEVEKLCEFLLDAAPRSRLDSYPQLLITKEILRRYVSQDIRMFSREKDKLKDRLFLTETELTKVKKKYSQTQTSLDECKEELERLRNASTDAAELQEKLAKAEKKIVELEAKAQDLWEKSEEQKSAFNSRLDEVRQSVKAKTEAAMERKLEAFKEIAAAASSKADALAKELAEAREQNKKAMEQLEFVKEQSAIKTPADVLKTLGLLPIEASVEVLQSLLKDKKVFEKIVEIAGGADNKNPEAKVKELFTASGVLKGSDISSGAAMKQVSDVKWEEMAAMSVWAASGKCKQSCSSVLDVFFLFAVPSPALEVVLFDAPKPTAALEELEKLKERNEALAEENEALRAENAELRSKAEGLEKELGDANDKISDLQKAPEPAPEAEKEPPKDDTVAKLLASDKQPQVLKVYDVKAKQLKGKAVQPHTIQNLLSLFANMYENKAQADLVDDRENNHRQSFPEYIRDFLINRFGLKSIALQNLKGMVLGIQKHSDDSDAGKRIKVFGLLSGILPRDCWHEDLSNFVLHALGLIFQVSKIKENMDHDKHKKPSIDAGIAMEASKQAWSKYGFGDLNDLEDIIIRLTQQSGGLLGLHEWLECMVEAWFEGSKRLDGELRSVFTSFDADGNGVLDMTEFSTMVRQLAGGEPSPEGTDAPPIDDRTVARLFAEALEESSAMSGGADGDSLDVMSAEGFIRVARKFHLGTNQNTSAMPAPAPA